MLNLLTMLCDIKKRGAETGTDDYNHPIKGWVTVTGVKCLYLTGLDDIVEEMSGRGVNVTGKLYVMADVDIDEEYQVENIKHSLSGAVVESGVFKVVKTKGEFSPVGRHHQVAYLARDERCK